ncbi:MAG: hypothetical protein ACF8AM_06610 [Rhodopirellula sp. JB055]|uniref:hypothetical protein n=1 Tax=Rhodopirellula sp. JB055 TaxID=3342846 RepID=UPI00370B0467
MNVTQTLPQNADQRSFAATVKALTTKTRDRQPPSHPEISAPCDSPTHDSLNQFSSYLRSDAAKDTTTYLHRANTHHDGE